MTRLIGRLHFACVCVAAALPALPATAAPQGVALKGYPVEIGSNAPLRNLRRLETGEGQSLVAVDTNGRVTVIGTDDSPRPVDAAHVADATLLRLGEGRTAQTYALWADPAGIGFMRLDKERRAASRIWQNLPGATDGGAATRLAAAKDGAGNAMILVGRIDGGLSALAVKPQGDGLWLESVHHWSVGGPVKAMVARGSRAYVVATTGLWSLDMAADDPQPSLEAAGRSGCLDASRDIGGLALVQDGRRAIVAVAQPAIQRIVAYGAEPGPDPCLGFIHVVHAADPEGFDTIVPSGLVGGAGASLLVSDANRPEMVGVPHLESAFTAEPGKPRTLASGQ